jgi:ABC-2 type transport system permease protein
VTSAPGSIGFLMRHELRLFYRGASHKVLRTGSFVALFVLLHLAAIPIALGAKPLSSPAPQLPLLFLSSFLALTGLTLTARALTLAVQALYERGDLDLLLSSPLPPDTLFAVRASAIALTLAAEVGVFLVPFVNVFVVFGYTRWAVAYLALPLAALLVTSLSLWLALLLLRWLGARRTRVLAQVLAALIGTLSALVTQLPAYLTRSESQRAASWLALDGRLPDVDSPVWWPARAVLGSLPESPLAALACVAAFAFTLARLSGPFTHGLVLTADASPQLTAAEPRRRRRRPRRWLTGPLWVLARKELVLTLRDPWLLTQMLQQNLYLLPIALVLFRLDLGGVSCAWLGVIFVAGGAASALAWVAASGEEAPELLGTAPITRLQLIAAELIASLSPVALFVAAASALLGLSHPAAAAIVGVCSLGNGACNAALHIRYKRPSQRSEARRRRMQHSFPLLLAELGFMTFWSGSALTGLYFLA